MSDSKAVGHGPQRPLLLEAGDVAQILGVSYATVYSLTKAGRLKAAYVTPRGVSLYRPEAVRTLAAAREETRRSRELARAMA
jgi:predicted site-specific integrase-resolvase